MRISKDLIEGSKQAPKSAVKAMEELEDWAINDPEINDSIEIMLDKFDEITKNKDIDKQAFVRFLTYLFTSNMMHVIDTIEDKDERFMDEFIEVVNELNEESNSKFSITISDRIMVLYRMFILPQIFSVENIESIEKGIEIMKMENGDL